MAADLLEILNEKYPAHKQENLVDMLLDAQEEFGFISKEMISALSSYFQLPESRIFSIASFYPQFRFKNKGKYHFRVCCGTSCHLNHSQNFLEILTRELKIQPGETTRNGWFSLETGVCSGSCGGNVTITINDEIYTDLTDIDLTNLINTFKAELRTNATR